MQLVCFNISAFLGILRASEWCLCSTLLCSSCAKSCPSFLLPSNFDPAFLPYFSLLCLAICGLLLIVLSLSDSRLLRPLYSLLPLLWVPDPLQHHAGLCHLWLLQLWGFLHLLLLLWLWGMCWLWPALWHGLWHHWCLLRVSWLSGDLHGVLWPLFFFLKSNLDPSMGAPSGTLRGKLC